MPNYLVIITAELPYPVEQTFRVECSGLPTAAARAIKQYRKYIHETKGKRKIEALRIKITKI